MVILFYSVKILLSKSFIQNQFAFFSFTSMQELEESAGANFC